MIRRLIGGLGALVVYFCVATVLAQTTLTVYLASTWGIDRSRLVQMLAIAQGVDLFALKEEAKNDDDIIAPEQVSFEQILEQRAKNVHHLQLREQALRDGLSQLSFEQRKLIEEKKRYKQLRQVFEEQLLAQQEGAVADGRDEVRRILESAKPKQSKELLVQMLQNDETDAVVRMLVGMPDVKRAKILSEFKTPNELVQLGEVLKRIREGYPNVSLPEDTSQKLQQVGNAGT